MRRPRAPLLGYRHMRPRHACGMWDGRSDPMQHGAASRGHEWYLTRACVRRRCACGIGVGPICLSCLASWSAVAECGDSTGTPRVAPASSLRRCMGGSAWRTCAMRARRARWLQTIASMGPSNILSSCMEQGGMRAAQGGMTWRVTSAQACRFTIARCICGV